MLKTRFFQGLAPRLILALVVMVGLVAGLAGVSTFVLHNISERAGKLTETTVPAHVTATQLGTTAQALMVQAHEISAVDPATDRSLLRQRLEGKKQELRNQVARFVTSNPDIEGVAKLRSDADKLLQVVDQLTTLARERAQKNRAQRARLARLRELAQATDPDSPLQEVVERAIAAVNRQVPGDLADHRATIARRLGHLPAPWHPEARQRRGELRHLLLGEGELFDTAKDLRALDRKVPTASMSATRFADRFTGFLADLRAATEATLNDDRSYIRSLAERAQGIAWTVPALALALTAALAVFLWRNVVKRLNLLQKAMAGFSAGESDPAVPQGADEIGNLGGQFVAMAQAINEQQAELTRLAAEDPLTGIANRRRFYDQLEAEVSRIQRSGAPIAVAILDIDYFKQINDTLGHDAGDAALQHLAGLLSERLRQTDVLGRLGGEEFGLLLIETGPANALGVCQELRQRVADNPCPWGDETIPLTASIGLVGLDAPPSGSRLTADGLITAADQALYASKDSGRNRVTQADAATLAG